MQKCKTILFFMFYVASSASAQNLTGKIVDSVSHLPLENVNIYLLPDQLSSTTDAAGNFAFRPVKRVASLSISIIGYKVKTVSIAEFQNDKQIISLVPAPIELSTITISPSTGGQSRAISKIDIALRAVSNSQEVIRLVPGLFIGQHQGGGKAEQIFLRGFDCDHGTDLGVNADDMPVNMVSHAHGQGYADSHFIIPETIGSVHFEKGPYYAEKGDFCTTGYVDYHTLNSIPFNSVKVEGGMYNTSRLFGMFNLLGGAAKCNQQSWYCATEYRYTDGYFDIPQHFSRFNFFTKYYGLISKKTRLNVSVSRLYSKWKASGQIPDRAVSKGIIGFYGALDPNEGGFSSRTNINMQVTTTLPHGDILKNQVYYSCYQFDLHTNFTFYLVDSINGDEIQQQESRNMYGYKGSYRHVGYIGSMRLISETGLQFRGDATHNSSLSHTKGNLLLNEIKLGNITEFSASGYVNETLNLNHQFSINAGIRLDQFYYGYLNKIAADSLYPGTGLYLANDNNFSPKLSIFYNQNENLEFYLSTGKGFHSNDARSVVAVNNNLSLPAAYGADLGTVIKARRNLLINAAVWYISLNQELVYSGDGGFVEFSGKTKRFGFDFSTRYQPTAFLFVDLDLNYAHGRSEGDPKRENFIPLAPEWTSTGGITYSRKTGLNGSLRYRFMGERPANAANSLTASGYFITDLVLNYTKKNYEIGITINNIFNTKWKETQFETKTRLKGEFAPADEICFTAGTPVAARLSFSVFFR